MSDGASDSENPIGRARLHFDTLAAHAAVADPSTGALTPPIHLSTTFERDDEGMLVGDYLYSRSNNPNRAMLEQSLAELEGGGAGIAFASGSAASMAILHCLDPGDHVIAPASCYYAVREQLLTIFSNWGLHVTFVDMSRLDTLEQALARPTRLVWIETPSNPLVAVTDIAAAASLAHRAGALVLADNSWATPALQRPLRLGADFVMHSTTKYLGGHHDVTGGAIIARESGPLVDRLRSLQDLGGAVPSPFDCWLVLRGIRTLPIRMRAHSAAARSLADFVAGHPAVSKVHYPGLPSDPGHAIAERQMSDFGGVLSIRLRGGREAALHVVRSVRLFRRATSFAGPESLIEHRASIEPPGNGTPDDLLRLSVGLENEVDLIADLERALAALPLPA